MNDLAGLAAPNPRRSGMANRFGRYADYRSANFPNVKRLPAHWRHSPLKFLVRINPDKLADDTDEGFEIEYVDIGNVSLLTGITSTERFRFADAPSRARRTVADGDTIVSTVRTYLKAVARISTPPENLVVSTGFAVLRPGVELNSGYLYRVVQSEPFVQRVVAHSTGVSYPAINPSDIGRFEVPVPPLEEQRAIAAFLDRETAKIDELVAKKQCLLQLLRERQAAAVRRAITRGLNTAVAMKPSSIEWLGDIPKHWEIKRLSWLTEFINDINHEMPPAVDQGVPFLSAKDLLDNGSLNFTRDVKLISEEDFERLAAKVRPRRDDIIYSRIGACLGKARRVQTDDRFLVSYSCCVIRLRQTLACPTFFTHLLDSDILLTEARLRTQGIGVPDLGLGEIGRFPCPYPPPEEQVEIAAHLNRIVRDSMKFINHVESGLRYLREYRVALITAAVTGQIDVRGLPE